VVLQYSGKDNPDLEKDIDTVLWSLIHLIEKKYLSVGSKLKKMEFANIIQFCVFFRLQHGAFTQLTSPVTLDVITSLTLSHPCTPSADDLALEHY
jgi:hypothetical protein